MKKICFKNLLKDAWVIYKKNWLNLTLMLIILGIVSTIFNPKNIDNSTLALIGYFIEAYLSIGYIQYLLKLARGEDAKFKDLFYGVQSFGHFVKIILVSILASLAIGFGLILFIIPGVIIALAFFAARYLIIEDKNLGIIEALETSWKMTKGYRWKIFLVIFLLAILNALGILALFLGLFITIPLSSLVAVKLYLQLKDFYREKGNSAESDNKETEELEKTETKKEKEEA